MTLEVSHVWTDHEFEGMPPRWAVRIKDHQIFTMSDREPAAKLRTQLLYEWLLLNMETVRATIDCDEKATELLRRAIKFCEEVPTRYVKDAIALIEQGIPYINAIVYPKQRTSLNHE